MRRQSKVAFPKKKYEKRNPSYNKYWDQQDQEMFRSTKLQNQKTEAKRAASQDATPVVETTPVPPAPQQEKPVAPVAVPDLPNPEPVSDAPVSYKKEPVRIEAQPSKAKSFAPPASKAPVHLTPAAKRKKIALTIGSVLLALIAVAAVLFFTVYLPNTPDNLFLQAQNLVAEGKTEQARTIYEKVLQADPSYSEAYLALARLDVEAGNANEAIADLEAVRGIDPSIEAYLVELIPTHTIDLEAGVYETWQSVSLSSERDDVTLYYTLDGSEPTADSIPYIGPINLPMGETTLSVRAIAGNGAYGAVETRVYHLDLRQPEVVTASPEAGVYHEETLVEMTAHAGDAIYYTLDGSDPTEESTLYEALTTVVNEETGEEETVGGIRLYGGAEITVRAISVTELGVVSPISEFVFDLTSVTPAPAVFDLESGVYYEPQILTMTAEDPSYTIYYTVNGHTPRVDGSYNTFVYTEPITLDFGFNSPIQAIVVNQAGLVSELTYEGYTILNPEPEVPAVQESQPQQSGDSSAADGSEGAASETTTLSSETMLGGPTTIGTTLVPDSAVVCAQLANQLRQSLGLSTLVIDDAMMQAAAQRAYEMTVNNNYGHTRPDGTKWNTAVRDVGYSNYSMTRENIAMTTYPTLNSSGYTLSNTTTGQHWYNKWRNSSGHYANMTYASVTKIGVGIAYRCDNGVYTVMACMLLL